MKLKRDRIGYGAYFLIDEEGTVIARADKTGTRRDNYPWSWYLWADLQFGDETKNTFGTEESLKACISIIEGRIEQHGIRQD